MGGGKCHLRTECPLVNEGCIEASSWGFINYVKEDCEASSPTSLPDDLPSTMNYEFVQGGLCGEDWRDMMRGAIELSRNNGEPAKDPMECAKLTAENSECGSYFVQRNDYHVCWCMSKQGVH